MLIRLHRRGWLGPAIYSAVLLPFAGSAIAQTPTAQALLAAQDKELASELLAFNKQLFDLPEELALDPSLRQAAQQIAREHLARVRALAPGWIAQERAASGTSSRPVREQFRALYFHTINEIAIWSVESGGPAHDEAWLKAALAPGACHAPSSAQFGQRIAMIQAAPLDQRPVLLAGERELLSRWGTRRAQLPPRPTVQERDAVDHAIARLQAGMPVTAEPMAPVLAGRLFDRNRKPGQADEYSRWERCAKSQWWLASQLASGKIDKTTALTTYRYATMADASEFAHAAVIKKAAAPRPGAGNQAYPPVAAYFNAEGSTTVEADADAQGKFLKGHVVARKITVPGVYNNPPIAFETLFDADSLDYAEKRHKYPLGKNQTVRFELRWHLSEANNEAH